MGTIYRKITSVLIVIGFSSSAGAETLLECSRIEDAAKRVACYDRLAGRVEEKMEEKYEGTTEQRVEARQESITEEVVGSDGPAPELLALEIKRVFRDRNRRLIYVMTDGRIFRRSPGSQISLKAGDKCNLQTGVMNSIFLVSEDGKKSKVKELISK